MFLYQSSFRVSLKKLSFCCWTKVAKNIIDYSLNVILFERNTCFSWFLPFFALDLFFFHAWSSKTFCHYFFNVFEKISDFFCLNLFVFCSKKSPQKKILILFFMFTLIVVTLLILNAFLLFSFFSYHVSSPCVCSRHVCLISLSLSLLCCFCLFYFFFNHLYFFFRFFFLISFLICSSFFVKLFLFYLHCCFAFFLVLFNRVRSNKINWSFFFVQNNHLLNPSKNLFAEFLLFDVKSLSSFFVLFFLDPCLCEVLKVSYTQQKLFFF